MQWQQSRWQIWSVSSTVATALLPLWEFYATPSFLFYSLFCRPADYIWSPDGLRKQVNCIYFSDTCEGLQLLTCGFPFSLSLCLFLWVILKRVQRCQHVQKYAKQYHKSCTQKKKSCNTVLYHPSFLWHHASFPDLLGLGNIVLAGLLPKISTSHAIQFHSAIEQPVKQAATWCTWITAQWNEEVWIWWRLTQCTTQLCVQCRWA